MPCPKCGGSGVLLVQDPAPIQSYRRPSQQSAPSQGRSQPFSWAAFLIAGIGSFVYCYTQTTLGGIGIGLITLVAGLIFAKHWKSIVFLFSFLIAVIIALALFSHFRQ